MKASLFFKRGFAGPAALKTFLFSLFLMLGQWAWGQVTLPHSRTVWNSTPSGWTDTPLDSYTTSFACSGNNGAKFDTNGDSKVVFLDSSPDKLSFTVKSNTSTTSSLLIQESDDGATYSTVINMSGSTDLPTSCTPKGAYQLKSTTRYVKWTFTKGSSNMTMDDVSITKLIATCTPPTTQASAFSSSAIAQTTATVGWTRGSGDNVLVVARAGAAVNADPASGTSYTANAAFGSGTQIGTGNFVVYNGAGNSVNLTGLTAGTTYHFAVYEYNTTGICYNITELTGNLTTASAPSLTATGTLNEGTLNGATVNLALANTSFTDATLNAANFTLNNAPAGVSIQSVAYNSATSATVTLAYNNTDFDTTINNFNITINGSELTSAANLTSNNLTISALAESLNVGSALAFGTVCNGSSSELSFTITGTNLKAGPITLGSLASYTYSESPSGVAITSFSQPDGTLNKTIYVTLTPTAANQTYNDNISVSGGAAPAVNKAVTGNSTVVTPAVVTNTVTAASITDTGATLRATSSTFGTCPATTTKGFVYAVNSVNSNPQNGGTGVITTTVTLGSAGSFTQPVTGLAEGTTYAYQAYLYNGTTYTYGGVQTFTTEFSGSLNTVTNTTACLTDDGGTISWSAPASGVSPTGYMVFAVTGATTPSDTASTSLADNNNANPNFSAGTNNATPASLGKLLYKGAATSVNISGLTENSIYSFLVLSYQDGGSVRRFNAAAAGGRALNNIAQDDVKTFTGTPSNTQVTLNWTYNSPTSCFDEVMIVANQGAVVFTPSGDGSLYTANAVYSTANQVVYKGTATSRAITGLTNGLEYCFKIWIRRGTTWSDGTVVCVIPEVVYCSIDSWSNLDSEITDVQLVGEGGSAISNATIGCTNIVQNYTSQNANLNRGGTYQVTVKFDDCNGGSFYNGTGGVWIDWNKDGDFADANEKIGTVAYDIATLDQPYTHTFTINVPSSQALGTYRMRVMQDEGATELNIDACTAPGYGAIEDYSITVIQPANAEINIKGGAANISIPNGFDEPYGLNNTLFAGTPINTDSAEKEFTIENLGLANLTLTGTPIINISGDHPSDFIVTQQAVSPVVNGVSTSFKIKFHPTVAGVRQADVSIASNDSDENPYIFRIQGTGTCAPLSITASPASGPVNTVVTFTSSVTDLSSATVTYNEVAVPTISATANKLEVAVPLGALDANFQVNLPNGCNFTHAFDVISSVTTDCEATTGGPSETPATDLIIYEVYDVKTGSGGVISIFNRTGFPVSLSSYSIQRSRDHTNLPGEPYYTYANLTGTLAAGGLAVVGVSTDNAACDYSAILTGNGSFGSGFNEDDGFRLVKGSIVVDVVHAPNTTGYYLRRKSENLSPSATYVSTQWTNQFLSEDQCLSDVGQTPSVKTPPIVDAHPSFAISCEVEGATLAITATQGVSGGNGLTFQWYVLPSSGGSWTAVTDGGVYSGATSATLNISNLTGLHNYQYYAQVRENTATCYTATNAVQIKEATNTWASNAWSSGTPVLASKVIIAGSYDTEINGALDVCELTVSTSGTMVVKPNYPVQVKKKIINQNTAENSFVVLSDANLIQIDDTDNEGTIKVERSVVDMDNTLPQIDYVYWSSPVFEQLIKGASGFSPNTPATGYQQYRESDDRFVTTPDTYFQAGKGYSIRSENVLANGYNKTYSFTGVPNNGDVSSPPLSKSPGADKGYNLIGNPYPSNIDFDLLYALNSSKIYNTAWLWTNLTYTPTQMGSDYEGNNYAVYNGTGGVPPASDWADYDSENPSGMIPNGNIKVGQGFIVQLKLAGVVDFKNNMRITDGGTFYQKGETKNRFWLTMRSPKNMVNTILIGYIPGATNAYETDFDGELFVVGSDSFYTVSGAKKLAIQGRDSNFTNVDVVPLANVFSEAGTYTIGLHTPEGIFNGTQNIFLKDKLLSKYINLSTDTSYTFTAVKGTDATRFEIVYKESSVLGNDDISKSDFTVYRNGNSFVVKSSKILGKVEVYDAGGRLIRQLSSKENTLTIDATDLPNAVYIIKAENEGDIKTKKILK